MDDGVPSTAYVLVKRTKFLADTAQVSDTQKTVRYNTGLPTRAIQITVT